MTASIYLEMLDQLLQPGMVGLSPAFVDAQVSFVTGCQQADGGFRGRQGDSDFYYTDFALRTLAFLAPDHAAVDHAARHIAHPPRAPRGTIECFNVLNARRLLERRSLPLASNEMGQSGWTFDPPCLIGQLQERLLPHGGLARSAGDQRASAYHTFLGALCFQMLAVEMPAADRAVAAIQALQQPDGGFVELAGQTASQTSATAAATAFLMMHDAITPDKNAQIANFLAHMQAADGGLKPHAAVDGGDLLSTFTGLLTLSALDGLHLVDLASVAQFLRNVAHPNGGFVACPSDDTPDVEYTYYGIATLALLQIVSHT
jgi:geranylgeranyl transferase type-2 subunit beta